MKPKCAFCGGEIHTFNSPMTHQKVTGWVARRGAKGGANGVKLPEYHEQYAHGMCLGMAKNGHVPGQMTIEDAA